MSRQRLNIILRTILFNRVMTPQQLQWTGPYIWLAPILRSRRQCRQNYRKCLVHKSFPQCVLNESSCSVYSVVKKAAWECFLTTSFKVQLHLLCSDWQVRQSATWGWRTWKSCATWSVLSRRVCGSSPPCLCLHAASTRPVKSVGGSSLSPCQTVQQTAQDQRSAFFDATLIICISA